MSTIGFSNGSAMSSISCLARVASNEATTGVTLPIVDVATLRAMASSLAFSFAFWASALSRCFLSKADSSMEIQIVLHLAEYYSNHGTSEADNATRWGKRAPHNDFRRFITAARHVSATAVAVEPPCFSDDGRYEIDTFQRRQSLCATCNAQC